MSAGIRGHAVHHDLTRAATAPAVCRDDAPTLAPCTDGSCVCKTLCTGDAQCPAGQWCIDDVTDTHRPCTDATCVCKVRTEAGFLDGALLTYGANDNRVRALGTAFGVSADRTQ
jgi:hypothetical protein